jgi:glycosyltransferase involved in cell wall biosynthesis
MERFVRPMTDHVFAVAPAIAREAVQQRLARPGAISVVPSAVELDRIPQRSDDTVRRDLGIDRDAPLVGTVGRLDFQKAPLDFVRMASLVAAARPGVRFLMVGDGSLEDATREEARRLGVEIMFTGFREDAARIASVLDVFVISSLYEGLGRSLTEALASGRPVVASAVNGVPDLVQPGTTGLLTPPRDPEALARSVIWMLDHPDEARRMGEQGRARVRALFQPRIMCALLEGTYRSLLGLPAPAPAVDPVGAGDATGNGPSRVPAIRHDADTVALVSRLPSERHA